VSGGASVDAGVGVGVGVTTGVGVSLAVTVGDGESAASGVELNPLPVTAKTIARMTAKTTMPTPIPPTIHQTFEGRCGVADSLMASG
jgi:hypothetical protein